MPMPNKSSRPHPGAQADADHGALAGPSGALADRPVLSIVRGQPTEAELAAVVAVLAVRARAAAALASVPGPAGASRSTWSDRSRQLREPIAPGRGAWRASALPR